MRAITRLGVVALVGAATILPMGSASATDAVTRSGSCSEGSRWSLRAAEAVGDQANIRLTVNSRKAGQTWSVQLFRNGSRYFATSRVTNAQGDFTVFRKAREVNDVDDVYTARARNRVTGETCFARVVLPD